MNTLFFSDSELNGSDIKLVFHKDFPYLYSADEFPLVRVTLKNCQNAQSFDFGWLRDDSDGATIEIGTENNETVFEIISSSDESIKIKCETVEKEDIEYRQADLHYLINELLKKQEQDDEMLTRHLKNSAELQEYFDKQLDSIDRKLKEANWLNMEKREFLKGQKIILENAIEILCRLS